MSVVATASEVTSACDCRIVVSEDRLSAHAAAPTGFDVADVSVRQIEDRMKEAGLTLSPGRKGELLARVDRGRLMLSEPLLICEGVAPVDPTPGRLERVEGEPNREEGECDHYHRSRLRTVKADQPVARIIPATDGADGRDVFGQPIPSGAAPPAFRLDPGANVRVDGDTVLSTCDGSLKIDGAKIWVEDFLHIKSNVDFSTGNIDFGGDVVIDGGVGDLFEVKARNLTVHKAIDAAHLVAAKHLHADGGIVGKEKAVVEAGEELAVRFIAGATVRCGGPVTVISEISNSHITCSGKLSLAKGTILHSTIAAAGGVAVRSLGSVAELPSVIEVGVSESDVRRLAHVVDEIHQRQVEHTRMRRLLEAALAMPGRLSAPQTAKARTLLTHLAKQDGDDALKLQNLSGEWKTLLASTRAEIEVHDKVHPGVTLRFPGLEVQIQESLKGPLKFVVQQVGWERKVFALLTSRHGALNLPARELDCSAMLRKLNALLEANAKT